MWLVPLAVLALPHRRILLAWMTIDALVWVPRMLYLYGEQNRGLPEQWFTAAVLLRDIAVIGLCVLVIRQIYRPELDLVRTADGSTTRPAGCSTVRPTARPAGCRSGCARTRQLHAATLTTYPRMNAKVISRVTFRPNLGLMAGPGGMKHVFYGITPEGDVHWHQLVGGADGRALWSKGSGTKIGSGFDVYTRVFSPGRQGVLYGVKANGDLHIHIHDPADEPSPTWHPLSGGKINIGWDALTWWWR